MRTHFARIACSLVILAGSLLSACSPSQVEPAAGSGLSPDESSQVGTPPVAELSAAASEYFLPPYYPDSYIDLVNASKSENRLVIYSSMNTVAWTLVIKSFNARYPWIEVDLQTMESDEVFNQYEAQPGADMLVSYSPDKWQSFEIAGNLEPYISQEEFYIPAWVKETEGLYGVACDAMLIVYNTTQVSGQIASMADINAYIARNPGNAEGRITTIDPNSSQASYFTNWFWTNAKGEPGWEELKSINASSPALVSTGEEALTRVESGEAHIGYFVPLSDYAAHQSNYPNLGWSYIADGQPLLVHMAGITRSAEHPASAALMLDYLLSQDGQLAIGMGGLLPFREDIAYAPIFSIEQPVRANVIEIENAIGATNIFPFYLDEALTAPTARERYLNTWNATLK